MLEELPLNEQYTIKKTYSMFTIIKSQSAQQGQNNQKGSSKKVEFQVHNNQKGSSKKGEFP